MACDRGQQMPASRQVVYGFDLIRSLLRHRHGACLNLDGAVVRTDRVAAPGPGGAALWWSGNTWHHGGNVQVIATPDGWPTWVSPVRSGREHDTICARHHGLIDALNRVAAELDMADPGRPRPRERQRRLPPSTQEARRRRADRGPAGLQQGHPRHPRRLRARQLPAQDHLQGPAPGQPRPRPDHEDRRSSPRPAPTQVRPHHLNDHTPS